MVEHGYFFSRTSMSFKPILSRAIGVPHEVDSYHTLVPLEPIDSIANQQVCMI